MVKATKRLDVEQGAIELCILTHRNRDHIGDLRALKETCSFEVASNRVEAEAIEKATGVSVDHKLEDGEVIPRCGGIRVINMIGHSQGNMCLLMGGN